MTKTANYNLNQWDATDPIDRKDFNSDNAAIDAALGELSTTVAQAMAALGTGGHNCRIAWGSYTGTGQSGHANNGNTPTGIVTGFKPVALYIRPGTGGAYGDSLDRFGDLYVTGETETKYRDVYTSYYNSVSTTDVAATGTVTWGADRVSFRCDESYTQVLIDNYSGDFRGGATLYCAKTQYNEAGKTYLWFAVGYDA